MTSVFSIDFLEPTSEFQMRTKTDMFERRSSCRKFDSGSVPIFRDFEILSSVILIPSTESFKKDCCQLQAKVCAPLVQAFPGKKCGR